MIEAPVDTMLYLHASPGTGTAGQCEPVGAILLANHHLQDIGGTGRVPGGKRHIPHSVYDTCGIYLCNVNVSDLIPKEIYFLFCHSCVLYSSTNVRLLFKKMLILPDIHLRL